MLQEALADAGFEPRFRRRGAATVEITLRDAPSGTSWMSIGSSSARVHRGLLEGMLGASRPPLALTEFEPQTERTAVCRLVCASRGLNPETGD